MRPAPSAQRPAPSGRSLYGFTLSQLRNSVSHPLRCRGTLQVVIEELLHPDLEVLLILFLRQVMRLVGVGEQNDLLAGAPGGVEVLESLHPIDRAIRRAVENEEWRLD